MVTNTEESVVMVRTKTGKPADVAQTQGNCKGVGG